MVIKRRIWRPKEEHVDKKNKMVKEKHGGKNNMLGKKRTPL